MKAKVIVTLLTTSNEVPIAFTWVKILTAKSQPEGLFLRTSSGTICQPKIPRK